ncbi:MAG TPA: hypothetical protein VHO24_11485 [Opitutaceae bacterium]|nr:hypothetical protein [Opitutaceae bacterium]
MRSVYFSFLPASPRLFVFAFAFVTATAGRAQAPAHDHPAMPAQPKPAGSTPASGSGAPASDGAPMAMENHAGMSMPMGHEMSMGFGPLPDSQDASGTAWQPAETPMHAHHSMLGDWMFMTHYNAFLAYDNQSGRRGDEQLNSINWLMLMARKRTPDNELTLRGMFSLEPATTTPKGYPLLFQSGEAYHGRALVDRQHPHDFFMELAARYRRLINPDTVFSLYVAPSGEPALGPAAFPHRMSAMDNPSAPISHHWLDSSHISFGVLTAGIAQKTWQVEGSWFNGREPDEDRWDIEHPKLDSYSGRFSWNPTPEWSAQISHGYLKSPEELHPREHLRRTTASVMHLTKLSAKTHLATTAAWGRNDTGHDRDDAFLIETSYMMERMSVFARAESVEKAGEELDIPPSDRVIRVKQLSLGGTHELLSNRPYQLALGGAVTWSFQPSDLVRAYGKRPMGVWIFLRLRPAAMAH